MSGKPLGRLRKNVSKLEKKQAAEAEKIRNQIEGKFGNAKRKYSLNRVMTKLSHTSETAIAITFLVMNLSRLPAGNETFFVIFCQKSLMGWF